MKTKLLINLLVFLQAGVLMSQTLKPAKSKVYKSTTLGVNKEAVLILYNDNTFTNYGVYSNDAEKDWYVWYTKGRCLQVGDKILFKSFDTIPDAPALIKAIKDSYLSLKEYALIRTEYEFVHLKYKDLPMFREDSLIIDGVKKITYLEKKL
jgi:hypothetical protein